MSSEKRCDSLLLIITVVALILFVWVYYAVNPEESNLLPQCPFKMITQLSCPACGNQRALHCFLHGDVGKALRYNFFLVVSIPYLICLIIPVYYRRGWLLRIGKIARKQGVVNLYLIAICLWWVVRNIISI